MFVFSQGETVFVKTGFVLEVETLLLGEASQTLWSRTWSSVGSGCEASAGSRNLGWIQNMGPGLDPEFNLSNLAK